MKSVNAGVYFDCVFMVELFKAYAAFGSGISFDERPFMIMKREWCLLLPLENLPILDGSELVGDVLEVASLCSEKVDDLCEVTLPVRHAVLLHQVHSCEDVRGDQDF